MRTLLITGLAALSLVVVPAASAKEENAAIVVGPTGTALVEPPQGFAPVIRRLVPAEAPGGPFALVYVQRRMIPGAPGRWYPRSATYCDARGRCVRAASLLGSFGSGRITGLFRGEPPHIVGLARDGRPLPPSGPLAHAVELAFGQGGSSARAAVPPGCVELRATWRGSPRRPSSFCVGMNGGVYAGGRVYPLYSGIADRLSR